MLIIRDEQMQVFSEYMFKQFEDRMVMHLKQVFPQKTSLLDEQKLRQIIRRGVTKAHDYGMELSFDVERYLDFMFRLSYEFDNSTDTPWAKPILADETLTAEEKLDQLEEYAVHIAPIEEP